MEGYERWDAEYTLKLNELHSTSLFSCLILDQAKEERNKRNERETLFLSQTSRQVKQRFEGGIQIETVT